MGVGLRGFAVIWRFVAPRRYAVGMADPGPSPYDRAVPPVFNTPPSQAGSVGAPPPPPPPTQPTCWKCGYNLSGVRVDGQCPECGTPIWSVPPAAAGSSTATVALVLGILGLVLSVTCIGPLAIGFAIPAIIIGRKASVEAVALQGNHSSARSTARAGVICGWVTVGLSVLIALIWVAFVAAEALF